MKTWIAIAAGAVGLMVLGGCVVEEEHHHGRERVVVEPAVGERVVYIEGRPAPEPLHEEITVRPSPEVVWVPGHWYRDHGYWIWERGHWE